MLVWEAGGAAGIQLPLESREIWGPIPHGKILSVKSEGLELEGVLESASKDKNQTLK